MTFPREKNRTPPSPAEGPGSAASRHYRLILFDCVNTLCLPNASRLPILELEGRPVTSTAGLLHPVLADLRPDLTPGRIHEAARAAWRWAKAQGGPELRQIPASERFRHLLGLLGVEAPSEELVRTLLDIHFAAVIDSFLFPPAHRTLLATLRPHHRLALFSNVDHAPALRHLLARQGIDTWLAPILISDDLGYRKPGRAAFSRALERLAEPPPSILFVGDSLEEDVLGARDAGLDVVWVNPGRYVPAAGDPRPTYTLPDLPSLAGLLGHAPVFPTDTGTP